MDLEPITLPAHWNAERDCTYFCEEGWLPNPNYQAVLSYWLNFHCANFSNTVSLSVACFLRRVPGLLPFEPQCLSTAEQIALLSRWVQGPAYTGRCRAEIAECLRACAFWEAERGRLLTDYQQAGEHAWLYPLVRLCEEVGGQAVALDEAMGWEKEFGYDEVKRRWVDENL